jgi:ribosomal-protein-alanine N-acetyltransferase
MMIDGEAEILSIGVTPDRQRQGVGKRLLQHFFDYGASRNMAKALLEVAEDNVPALELYQRFWFCRILAAAKTITNKVIRKSTQS